MATKAVEPLSGGPLAAEISNMMVALLAEYTGRGPTKAHTTLGRDHVLVLLEDTLTQGERQLARNGHADAVLDSRKLFQRVFRDRAVARVEELTSRTVVGFMSDNHVDPDLGAELFVLEPKDGQVVGPVDAESG